MRRLITAKRIIAEWRQVDINKTDITNVLTDAMINNSIVKINYLDSGWRNCLPYGWYVTKAGNIILYVYKEDLSIRSYRLDRILELYIDDKLNTEINKKDNNTDEDNFEDFELLNPIPNAEEDNEQGATTPFDDSLEILETDFNSDFHTLNNVMENTTDMSQQLTDYMNVNTDDDMNNQNDIDNQNDMSNQNDNLNTQMVASKSIKFKRLIGLQNICFSLRKVVS